MGNMQAAAYAELYAQGVRSALSAHLTSNHYPPLPHAYLDVAQAALAKAVEAGPDLDLGEFDNPEVLEEEIEVPNTTEIIPRQSRRDEDGRIWVTVSTALEIMHLWDFVFAAAGEDEDD